MSGNLGFIFNRFGEEVVQSVPRPSDSGETTIVTTAIGVTPEQLDEAITLVKSQVSESLVQMLSSTRNVLKEELSESLKDTVTKRDIDELKKTLEPSIKLAKSIEPIASSTIGVKDSLGIKDQRRISTVSRAVEAYDAVVKIQLDEFKHTVDDRFKSLDNWKKNAADTMNEMYLKLYKTKPTDV